MDVSEAKRLRALEDENAKLKRMLADAMLDNVALKDLPGMAMQNGFIGSFNGYLRGEMLNETLFSRPEPRSRGGSSTTTPSGHTPGSDGRR